MKQFQNNIWLLFKLMVALGVAGFVAASIYKWHEVTSEFELRQQHQIETLSNSLEATLNTQAVLLTFLGDEVLQDMRSGNTQGIPGELARLRDATEIIAGLAVVDTDGSLLFTSETDFAGPMPNLLQGEATSDSFKRALQSDNVMLGRTYFMKELDEWIIPIRKALKAPDGQVMGIMTAGLRLSESGFLNDSLRMGEYNNVSLVRESDRYVQYSSHGTPEQAYRYPVPQYALDNFERQYRAVTGYGLEHLKSQGTAFKYLSDYGEESHQSVARYIPKYQLWVLSEVNFRTMYLAMIPPLVAYLLIFVVLGTILFFLIRLIVKYEAQKLNKTIEKTTKDYLTGLPNRYFLFQFGKTSINQTQPRFVASVKLVGIGQINDMFGIDYGDHLIIRAADSLRNLVAEGDILLRGDHDQFIILSSNPVSHLERIVQALNERWQSDFLQEGDALFLRACMGVVDFERYPQPLSEAIKSAGLAVAQANKESCDVYLFRSELKERRQYRALVERKLRRAINEAIIEVYYQPQVTPRGDLIGVEALARWHDNELGFIGPDVFIPIAETSDLIHDLGRYIFNVALQDLQRFNAEVKATGGPALNMSINLSVKQLQQSGAIERLIESCPTFKDCASQLTFEMTESIFIEETQAVQNGLTFIRGTGAKLSLDDFGTGYSSLSVLAQQPIDEVKIDKAFIDSISTDQAAQHILTYVKGMCDKLGLVVVFEGVETEAQCEFLAAIGAQHLQGYLFAKPMPANQLIDYIHHELVSA